MQDTLVIYLHRLTELSWVVIKQGSINDVGVQKDIEDCAALAKLAINKKVIVIVPAYDVLLTSASLPKMTRSRMLKAIPFALEDELINDIEELHFAASDKRENPQPVAVVAKSKIKEWLEILAHLNIKPDIMVPISLAVPFEVNSYTIVIADETAVVRINEWKGFSCEKQNLNQLLKASLSENENLTTLEKINIYNYGDTLDALDISTNIPCYEHNASYEQFVKDLANRVMHSSGINLLQKEFLPKRNSSKMNQTLLYLNAGVIAFTLIVTMVAPFVSMHILNGYQIQLNNQIVAIYKKNFPNAQSVIAPKERMETKLRSLINDSPKDPLLLMLAHIGNGLNQVYDTKVKRLDYQNNQVTLAITAQSSDDFNKFTNALSQSGLTVHQQNASLDGDRVNANLQIEIK